MSLKHSAYWKVSSLTGPEGSPRVIRNSHQRYLFGLGKNINIYIGNSKVDISINGLGVTLIYKIADFCQSKIEINNDMLVFDDKIAVVIDKI